MTGDELRHWQVRCGYRTDAEAARALGIGLTSYRDKIKGRVPIRRQTELLTAFIEIHSVRWLHLAEQCYRLARHTSSPVTPAAAAAVADLVTDASEIGASRR